MLASDVSDLGGDKTLNKWAPDWITYSPLLPLGLLLVTGLYLFVLPYLAKRRG